MTEPPKKMSIKEWSMDDRPREKLMQSGRKALSNAELVAILLGSGTRDKSAVELSRDILNKAENSLNKLGEMSIKALMQFKGIGQAKAITLAAATELGRRRKAEIPEKKPVIDNSNKAFQVLQPLVGDLAHEEFWVLFLNNSNQVVGKYRLSQGGMTSTIVDVRLVFKHALESLATAILIGHNHPSGKLRPSKQDHDITTQIKKAGEVMNIKLLDHLIVTEHGYYSFADEGVL